MTKIPDLCNAWATYSIKGDVLECAGFCDGGKAENWRQYFLVDHRYDFSDTTPFDISQIRGVIGFEDWDEEIVPIADYFKGEDKHFNVFFISGKFPCGEQCILKLLINKTI